MVFRARVLFQVKLLKDSTGTMRQSVTKGLGFWLSGRAGDLGVSVLSYL